MCDFTIGWYVTCAGLQWKEKKEICGGGVWTTVHGYFVDRATLYGCPKYVYKLYNAKYIHKVFVCKIAVKIHH